MEHDRFDELTRRFSRRGTRRGLLARSGKAALAAMAGIALGRSRAAAQILPCAEDGCRCRPGDLASCTPGLVCCADNPDAPGGSGTCVPPSQCFAGTCSGDGVVCPATCTRETNCLGCCSGYCGSDGLCGGGPCRSAGCECISGALAPCDEGLACCPTIAGLPGGPGICAPRGICE
ncbi:MAG: hypothetical protein IT338_01175 [Thermomicrobiales bacterium]|nr:hypothetical protein [Thermomicrobiales bacterium]